MRRSARVAGKGRQLTIAAVEAGPTLEEPELRSLPDADGDQEFRDRSAGLPLNPKILTCNTWRS